MKESLLLFWNFLMVGGKLAGLRELRKKLIKAVTGSFVD